MENMLPTRTASAGGGHWYRLLLLATCLAGTTAPAAAHPVPKGSHDRTITVRLTATAVVVEYRLEVDLWTIIYQDLSTIEKQADLGNLSEPAEFCGVFTRLYSPLLAGGLRATVDGKPLTFVPERQGYEVPDSIRCDFVYRAAWQPRAGKTHRFDFRDGNFKGRPGQVKVSLAAAAGVRLSPVSPGPGLIPEEAARSVRTDFTLVDPSQAPASEPKDAEAAPRSAGEDSGLLRLFFNSRRAFWWLLLMAAALGGRPRPDSWARENPCGGLSRRRARHRLARRRAGTGDHTDAHGRGAGAGRGAATGVSRRYLGRPARRHPADAGTERRRPDRLSGLLAVAAQALRQGRSHPPRRFGTPSPPPRSRSPAFSPDAGRLARVDRPGHPGRDRAVLGRGGPAAGGGDHEQAVVGCRCSWPSVPAWPAYSWHRRSCGPDKAPGWQALEKQSLLPRPAAGDAVLVTGLGLWLCYKGVHGG